MKYLKKDKRTGSFQYRRRVPLALKNHVQKREFIKVLGKTQAEAIMRYGEYHAQVEHLVSLAKNGVTGLSPTEQADRLTALLATWGADPNSPGLDANERTWREEAAGRLLDKYQDPNTGAYVGVPEEAGSLVGALLSGVEREAVKVTVRDAF